MSLIRGASTLCMVLSALAACGDDGPSGPFLLVRADMKIPMVRPTVGQPVDEPRVAVIGEDDGFVGREEGVKVAVGEAVGMLLGTAGDPPSRSYRRR